MLQAILSDVLFAQGHEGEHGCRRNLEVLNGAHRDELGALLVGKLNVPALRFFSACSPSITLPFSLALCSCDHMTSRSTVYKRSEVHLFMAQSVEARLSHARAVRVLDRVLVEHGRLGLAHIVVHSGRLSLWRHVIDLDYLLLEGVAHHTQAVEQLKLVGIQRELFIQRRHVDAARTSHRRVDSEVDAALVICLPPENGAS
mmetsp:Transcript_55899/g.90439  ORF Transcript_55899/g.90439 Transcript_55899/m.90439 type:complete len:201 (-) Transcript_55899:715-1317(-)